MNIRENNLVNSRPGGLAPLGRLAKWLNSKLSARRARRMEEETLACLSSLEPSLLNDIGAHIGKIGDSNSIFAAQNPSVITGPAANPQPSRRPRRREHS